MDIEEIKEQLKQRGWTQADLAEKLGLKYSTLRKIMSGICALTPRVESHIKLLFEQSMTAVLVYTIDFPDEELRSWVPMWDRMSKRQRVVALKKVFQQVLGDMIKEGNRCLAEEDADLVKTLIGPEWDEENDEGNLDLSADLDAAEDDDPADL